MTFVLCVIVIALVFEYINGFHDTANAIATSVATRALTTRQAIVLSASWNLVGALMGTAVAKTIGSGLVDTTLISPTTVACALAGGIIWNLLTWYIGLPSSSSHALIGGLCGAALASAGGDWNAIVWFKDHVKNAAGVVEHVSFFKAGGMLPKVIVPMFVAPTVGLLIAYGLTGLLYVLLRLPRLLPPVFGLAIGFGVTWMAHTITKSPIFAHLGIKLALSAVIAALLWLRQRRLLRSTGLTATHSSKEFKWYQLGSASWMSYAHGLNDAQKTMGIIALLLFTATTKGNAFKDLPHWLEFLRTPKFEIAVWVKVVCAITIALGTAAGGWRIVRTLGKNLIKMQPVHGFAAQTTAAAVIEAASSVGIPLSTTHVISGSIMGVGATKRFNAVKWTVAERMIWAWLLTLPVCATLAFIFTWLAHKAGY
ncbi:MAG TPA: inorganic phosphate transporter [Verrucomicrobiae bacterium]|nr:inorganic phosphate transporter [Verrucomicrobiae bacterium]